MSDKNVVSTAWQRLRAEAHNALSPRRLGPIRRLLGMLRPYRLRFYAAATALLLASGATLAYPQAVRFAFDAVEGEVRAGRTDAAYRLLNEIGIIVAALVVVQVLFIWIRHYLMSWLGERVVTDLRRRVFDRLLSLPPAWFQQRRSGEIVGRLASDVTVVQGVIGSELSMALRNAVTLVGGVTLLVLQSPSLTLFMLAIVPPLMVAMVVFGRLVRRLARAVQDRLAAASAHLEESVAAMETVQAFVREHHEARAYGGGVEAAFAAALQLARWRASFMATTAFVGFLGIGGILWVGGLQVVRQQMSLGELIAFLMYTMAVAGAVATMAGLYASLQRAAGATERIFEIIDTEPQIQSPPDALALPQGRGQLRLEEVSFTYGSRPNFPVLEGIELDVAPGELVALVGRSGAGKSTLVSLLFRFHDVTAGRILYEGVDLRRLELPALRRSMALVAQEPVLFSGTIRDNIAYGAARASAAQVVAAARQANAHEFILRFPDGYDTEVGERGIKLSGGQKQRVAIARAILADPRVLVLDEATSNLDAESEAAVQDALAHLMRGRTTLVIAHRLSTVRDADKIVVLDAGRIVELGTHDTLLERRGVYAQLVEHQVIAAPLWEASAGG